MKIDGQNIVRIKAMNTMYHQDSVIAYDDKDNEYRIKVAEFLKLINGVKFTVVKKRVHTYLEID